MDNIDSFFAELTGDCWISREERETSIMITRRFLMKHGEELFPNPLRYMTGPLKEISDGQYVEAKHHKFKYERPSVTKEQENQPFFLRNLHIEIADQIAEEYSWLIEYHESQGEVIYPYLICGAKTRLVNPSTMDEVMRFWCKFGVGPSA